MNKWLFIASTLTAALLSTSMASAGNIVACSKDSYMSERIKDETSKDVKTEVLNKKGEVVGVLIFGDASKDTIVALYLCGDNDGYFYVRSETKDWISAPGKKISIGAIYNDETEVQGTGKLIRRSAGTALVEATLSFKWGGEDESHADHSNFTDTVIFQLPN